MADRIYLTTTDGNIEPLEETAFALEDELQTLIADLMLRLGLCCRDCNSCGRARREQEHPPHNPLRPSHDDPLSYPDATQGAGCLFCCACSVEP